MRPRPLFTLLICLTLSPILGCLPTYVGDPETSQVDPKYVGIWHLADDHQDQLWFVHKLDARVYLTQGYNFKRSDTGVVKLDDTPITTRAWLTQIEGATFVSMETYSPKMLLSADDAATRYIVARVEIKDDKLVMRSVSPEALKGKNITTPQQLEALLKANIDDKALYLDTQTLTRIDPQQPAGVRDLLDLVK